MPADDIYSKLLPILDPMMFKAVTPLSAESKKELEKIQALDVTGFYEQEVRSNVIDPVVRILGYSKGTNFSLDEGRPIQILEKDIIPDYKFHMWQQNFWIIEAKRPKGSPKFTYPDLRQALEYGVHPTINATLIVLCDGDKFQIFDREVSLTEPALHVDRVNLVRDFPKLQRFLEPMQIWFFEKRRIARMIDKVFDKEFNMHRVEEFRDFIDRRLSMKRNIILENYRANIKPDLGEQAKLVEAAPVEDLLAVVMHMVLPIPQMNAMIRNLSTAAEKNAFHVIKKMLPEEPQDANDIYCAHALGVLMELGRRKAKPNWIPVWLAGPRSDQAALEIATQKLLRLCLTCFEEDQPRKVIVLAAAAFRRLSKVIAIGDEQQWKLAQLLHIAERYQAPELSWQQILSSPARHLLGRMESNALNSTETFVKRCRADGQGFMREGEFKLEFAKKYLKELWETEIALLQRMGNYAQLRKERDLGEMDHVEGRFMSHDFLGHMALCVMHGYDNWKEYALRVHRKEVEELAALGSHAANVMLGKQATDAVPRLPDDVVAQRFFYGNKSIMHALREGYRGLV